MDETRAQRDTPLKGQSSSDGKSGSTSPRTYTEAEINAAIAKTRSDALAEAGRRYKQIEDENSVYKSQLATNQSLIKETDEKIARLQEEIEDMASDDPDRQKLIKRMRELDGKERKMKSDQAALEADRTANSERNQRAEKWEREQNIKIIAAQFEGIGEEKLLALCDRLNLTTAEQISAAAETLGTKKAASETFKADSGVTSGGAEDISKMSPHEKILYGIKKSKK